MKQKITITHSESKIEKNPLNEIELNKLNLDLLYNKYLNNKDASIIVNKEYLSNKKGNHIHIIRKEKPPILLTNNSNVQANSKLMMHLSPRSILSPNEANNKLKKKILYKHKNFYSINISDNSYNFHQHKKVIDEDKKLLIYYNNKGKNEVEKCTSSPKINENKFKTKDIINNKFSSKTSTHFYKKIIEKLNINTLLKSPLLNTNKEENHTKRIMLHSQSMTNTTKSFFDKRGRELNTITSKIKEEVQNYFIKYKFSSIKDYFNDWLYFKRKKDYQKKLTLDEDDIYYYLKEKIGVKVYKDEVEKIFKCKKIIFDINMFKYFFFEEDSIKRNIYITDTYFPKFSKFNFYNKHKEDNKFLSFSDIFKNSKYSIPIFKNNLLISALKEHKSKIISQICYNLFKNNKRIEYDYSEFSNLFQNLNVDKKIVNYKTVRKIFNKFKNANDKVNIKYFIDNLFKNDNIKDEFLSGKNENKKNIIEHLTNSNNYNSNTIKYHLNEIELNKNDNMNDIRQRTPLKEIENYNFKPPSNYIKKEININNNSSSVNKFIKFDDSKIKKKFKKKKIFTNFDLGSKNNHFANTTRETKQNFWRLNSYRTIRLRNQSTTNDSNILTNGKNTTSKKFNQIETNILKFNKCLFGVINNNNKNYSNAMNNETIKILPEEPRIQKLNSDIINYI